MGYGKSPQLPLHVKSSPLIYYTMQSPQSSAQSAHPFKVNSRIDQNISNQKTQPDWDILINKIEEIERMLRDLEVVMQKGLLEVIQDKHEQTDGIIKKALKASVMEATSGISLVMGLQRRELKLVMRFIAFRNQYPNYDDEELFRIIDKKGALGLLAKFSNLDEDDGLDIIKNMSATFSAIQQAWEEAFPAHSPQDIQKLIERKASTKL